MLKEMDFKHLECLILASGIQSHHNLVKVINNEWAQLLGFSLKMRRPPKENRDGCKTMRLYCASVQSGSKNGKAERGEIEEHTGLKEQQCYFALSFKYVSDSKTWIVNDTYSIERMWHTHAYYHSYAIDD
jgi:hypothetical protein